MGKHKNKNLGIFSRCNWKRFIS